MRVTVRLFAGLRERAGWSTREIDADRVGEVWSKLDLGEEPEGLLYAQINKGTRRSTRRCRADVSSR